MLVPEPEMLGNTKQAYEHACELARHASESYPSLAQFVCYRLTDRAFVIFNARDLGILAQEGEPLWGRLNVYVVYLAGHQIPMAAFRLQHDMR
jgi:hypothetical protein